MASKIGGFTQAGFFLELLYIVHIICWANNMVPYHSRSTKTFGPVLSSYSIYISFELSCNPHLETRFVYFNSQQSPPLAKWDSKFSNLCPDIASWCTSFLQNWHWALLFDNLLW